MELKKKRKKKKFKAKGKDARFNNYVSCSSALAQEEGRRGVDRNNVCGLEGYVLFLKERRERKRREATEN